MDQLQRIQKTENPEIQESANPEIQKSGIKHNPENENCQNENPSSPKSVQGLAGTNNLLTLDLQELMQCFPWANNLPNK